MRVSVIVGDQKNGLAVTRYTAKTSDVGFLTFVEYDELERATTRHQWRRRRMWAKADEGRYEKRADGVEVVQRPALPDTVKKQLLAAAREQIEWAKDI